MNAKERIRYNRTRKQAMVLLAIAGDMLMSLKPPTEHKEIRRDEAIDKIGDAISELRDM